MKKMKTAKSERVTGMGRDDVKTAIRKIRAGLKAIELFTDPSFPSRDEGKRHGALMNLLSDALCAIEADDDIVLSEIKHAIAMRDQAANGPSK
jgi:hypothetical protein